MELEFPKIYYWRPIWRNRRAWNQKSIGLLAQKEGKNFENKKEAPS